MCLSSGDLLFLLMTQTIVSHKDFSLHCEILNSEVLKLTQWRRVNKLSITFKKSELCF